MLRLRLELLGFILFFAIAEIKAQQDTILPASSLDYPAPKFPEESKWGIKFSGFINSQIFWDTRQSESSRETMLLFYPKNESLDANGKDINAVPSMNQLAIISRLSGAISGPNLLGAKFRGLLEADFSGQTNEAINLFRLRHAFVLLDWKHSDLLIGQTWHPMNVPEMMPGLSPLNNGAPFHAFSRHVQIRYIYRVSDFRLIATAASQRDNSSTGPKGVSPTYLMNTAIPNLDFQLQYRKGNHLLGAGVDYKILKPRLETPDDPNDSQKSKYKLDATIPAWAAIAFWNYKTPAWNLKLEAVWGQNQFEHLMMGGYVESPFDTISHSYSYTNLEQFSVWVELSRAAGKWRPGIFVGFAQNLGFQNEMEQNVAGIYARGANIDHVFRVSPRLSFFASQKLIFTAEIEYTSAAYGNMNGRTGAVNNAKEIGMARFLLDVTYHF